MTLSVDLIMLYYYHWPMKNKILALIWHWQWTCQYAIFVPLTTEKWHTGTKNLTMSYYIPLTNETVETDISMAVSMELITSYYYHWQWKMKYWNQYEIVYRLDNVILLPVTNETLETGISMILSMDLIMSYNYHLTNEKWGTGISMHCQLTW